MVMKSYFISGPRCLGSIKDFKIQRRGRQRERQENKRFNKQNLTTLHVHHAFLYISILFFTTSTSKCLIWRFKEDVNKQRRNFISLSEIE